MPRLLPMALLVATLSTLVACSSAPTPAAVGQASIDTGRLQGVVDGGVVSFKGIPFAAPPVAALRWRAPQPAASWTGVRDASAYGPDCMQKPFPSDAAPLGTTPAEDCLYANVWKPAKASGGKRPVMVWIYGGGFVNGGASPPTYSGAALAAQGIVVVSFNYRVGRFGTFAYPQLTAQDPDHGLLGNYGFMDQLAALQWVQRNVGAFGGDPDQVTIIGESAGGMSVHTLLTSPLTKGLFARAVIQSGGDGVAHGDLASAQAISVRFAQQHGIAADDPQALSKLRALSADAVTDGLNLATMFAPGDAPKTFSSPVVDGRLAVDSAAAYAAGAFNRVPVMVGATSDDIGGRDGFMIAGARQVAKTLTEHGVPTWYYRFGYVAQSVRTPQTKGAGHASDIPFFFDTVDIKYGQAATAQDLGVGRLVSRYLVNFVRTGDPNGAGLPTWPAYGRSAQDMLDFNAQGQAMATADPWAP